MRENLRARLTQKGSLRRFKMVKNDSIGQEVSALDKRTRTISRSGIVLLISGLVTLVVAGGRLCHFAFVKSGY